MNRNRVTHRGLDDTMWHPTLARLFGPEFGSAERLPTLVQWWEEGALDLEALRACLPEVWISSDAPLFSVTPTRIVKLFRAAGFLTDIPGLAEPPSKIAVYRGCHPNVRLGMAWTTSLEKATWYAAEYHQTHLLRAGLAGGITRPHVIGGSRTPARVYRATAYRKAILAMFQDREESEVVVDPRLLTNHREIPKAAPR